MFVLLFAFVFGGAIAMPGYSDPSAYREYLMPGIFVQTIVFAAATDAIGMCDDINKGIVDRFRSLPMARSAVLTGRSVADVVYNAGILVVLMVTGFLVGWTNHNGIVALLAGRRPAPALRVRDVMDRRSGSGRPFRRSRSRSRSRSWCSSRSPSCRRPSCRSPPCRIGSSRSPCGIR